jgi:anti-sigma regulatory factor (Ser/Thr protein kinase)/ABC-type transporter Mla MlaB component
MARFEQLPPARGTHHLVLDLSELSFIDSSGMRAIIIVERSAGERGLTLTIVPPPDALTDLLQITGVADRAALAPQTGDQPAPRPFIERIELELGRETTAPGRARAELREAFSGRLSDSDQATATLLTSELVTNAVIHPPPDAGGSIGLRIAAYADRVRVEVSDPGAGFDAGNLPPRPREMGGQGLFVVDGLSSRWGTARRVIDDQDVFCVWFELDLEYDLSAAPGAPEREIAAAEG